MKLGHDGSLDSTAIVTVSDRHDRFLARRRRQQDMAMTIEEQEREADDSLDPDNSCDDLNDTCRLLYSLLLFKVNHVCSKQIMELKVFPVKQT